jgi:tRNA threonylcarbamoyladenosine biosynthesis protein TsaE
LGASLGREAVPGAIICLSGQLGVGKTVIAQGIAAGLGVTDSVTSPTFVYVRVHQGRLTFYHVDLYQVAGYNQLSSLGLDEVFDAEGVVAIEWPDRLRRDLPAARLDVAMTYEKDRRVITLTPTDGDHAAMLERARGG